MSSGVSTTELRAVDAFRVAASKMFNVDYNDVTDQQRAEAKAAYYIHMYSQNGAIYVPAKKQPALAANYMVTLRWYSKPPLNLKAHFVNREAAEAYAADFAKRQFAADYSVEMIH